MRFTDTHAHIFHEYFEDFNKVIESAADPPVANIGSTTITSLSAISCGSLQKYSTG